MKTWIISRLAVVAMALCVLPAWAAGVSGQGTWETTLLPRYFDGDALPDAYYDTVLGITWLADANYAGATMNWATATTWAASLSLGPSGQWDDWRLPFVVDTGTSGCNQTNSGTDCGYNVQTMSGSTVYSEMAHMFYVTLGNIAQYNTSGFAQVPGVWGLTNTGPFSYLQGDAYWSGTAYAPDAFSAWSFYFNNGYQGAPSNLTGLYAWAVSPGDIGASAPVPLPAAAWLLGSGLLGFFGVARSRRPAH